MLPQERGVDLLREQSFNTGQGGGTGKICSCFIDLIFIFNISRTIFTGETAVS